MLNEIFFFSLSCISRVLYNVFVRKSLRFFFKQLNGICISLDEIPLATSYWIFLSNNENKTNLKTFTSLKLLCVCVCVRQSSKLIQFSTRNYIGWMKNRNPLLKIQIYTHQIEKKKKKKKQIFDEELSECVLATMRSSICLLRGILTNANCMQMMMEKWISRARNTKSIHYLC